jgi:hypothetical protein
MSTFCKSQLIKALRDHPFVAVTVFPGPAPIWSWYGAQTLPELTEKIAPRREAGCRVVFFDRSMA